MKDYFKIKIFFWLIVFLIGGFVFLKFMQFEKTEKRAVRVDSIHEEQGENEIQFSEEIKPKTKILFVGDIMFDRYIRQIQERKGSEFIFERIKKLLKEEDLVVGNLEGPITENDSKSVGTELGSRENYIFTFAPAVAGTLFQENIKLVNLGNNHILNFGENGLEQTKKHFDEANVKYFGNIGHDERNIGMEINEISIGFVNYNQFARVDIQQTLKSIEEMKKRSNLVFVYAHWGTEYEKNSSQNEKDLAHQFVDTGADLVIGTHPHVVQEKEEYRGKMIYYSLGNFIFDQYFNPDATQGLAVEVKVDPKTFQLDFKDINLTLQNNGQTKIAD